MCLDNELIILIDINNIFSSEEINQIQAFIPGLNRLATAAHAGEAKIDLQLAHGECFASESVTGKRPITPSGKGTVSCKLQGRKVCC